MRNNANESSGERETGNQMVVGRRREVGQGRKEALETHLDINLLRTEEQAELARPWL